MKVFILLFLKSIMLMSYNFSRFFKRKDSFMWDLIIFGKGERKSIEEEHLISKLQGSNTNFIYCKTTEHKFLPLKIIAYIKASFLLCHAKNVIVYDFCMPLYVVPKQKNALYFQLWHSNGVFKSFGISHFYEKHGEKLAKKLYDIVPIHSNYDFICVSSEKAIPYIKSAFNCGDEQKFIVANNATMEILNESKKKYKRKGSENKIKMILAQSHDVYTLESNVYSELSEELIRLGKEKGQDIEIQTLLHPSLTKDPADKIEKLCNADILITDFSTVCFEAEAIGCKVAFLRDEKPNSVRLFHDVAKKVYYKPCELACDILENKLADNCLGEYICSNNQFKMSDALLDIIENNRSKPKLYSINEIIGQQIQNL